MSGDLAAPNWDALLRELLAVSPLNIPAIADWMTDERREFIRALRANNGASLRATAQVCAEKFGAVWSPPYNQHAGADLCALAGASDADLDAQEVSAVADFEGWGSTSIKPLPPISFRHDPADETGDDYTAPTHYTVDRKAWLPVKAEP